MPLGTSITVDRPHAIVGDEVRAALRQQGFGVITEIDVQATLREKLGEQTDPYLILGACDPAFAHRALTADPSIGLLLPCNVVVRAHEGRTVVEVVDPILLIGAVGPGGHPSLSEVADEASRRLNAALDAVANGPVPTP